MPVAALIFDLSLLGAAAQIFVKLRHDEGTRRYMHTSCPLLLKGQFMGCSTVPSNCASLAYYWGEDKISGGHLKGSRLKQLDLNRWMLAVEGGEVEQALDTHIDNRVGNGKDVEADDEDDDEDD